MPPADAVALVTTALQAGGLCAECIARATGVAPERVRVLIERAVETFATTRAVRRCEGCSRITDVVRLGG